MPSIEAPRSKGPHFSGRFATAGYLIGLGLGGFFDGILLHQVLQWHHLLSLVDNPAVQDIRVQILADGLFHVLMYIVATVGLVYLWKTRHEFSREGAGRWLFGTVLLGFGLWNVADVGLFHWILQIHRIRVDSDNPLFWDLLWLAIFGVLFLIAGWRVRLKSGSGNGSRLNRSTSAALIISGVVVAAGTWAALPPPNSNTTLVMFKSGLTAQQVFHAFDAAGAQILWADRTGTVWAVKVDKRSNATRMYRHGALLISNSAIALGCLSWLKT